MMDRQHVARRRSTIFERIQFELTHSSVIRKRISPGKFPMSSVGIVKLISVIFFFAAVLTFLTYDTCPSTPDWYVWLFTLAISLGAGITIILYGVFTLGIALKYTGFWFVLDIILCIALAIFVIAVSIITMDECKSTDTMYQVPGPLGMCGSVFLIIAAAGLYIMYRHKETVIRETKSEAKANSYNAPEVFTEA